VLPPLVAGCAPEGLTTEGRAAHDAYNGFLMAAAFVFGVVAVQLLVGGALPPPQRGAAAADPRQHPRDDQRVRHELPGGGPLPRPVRPVQPRQLRRDAMPREGRVTAQVRSLRDVGAGGASTGGGT